MLDESTSKSSAHGHSHNRRLHDEIAFNWLLDLVSGSFPDDPNAILLPVMILVSYHCAELRANTLCHAK